MLYKGIEYNRSEMFYRDYNENVLQLNHEGDCLFLCAYVREAEWDLLKYVYLS